METDNMSRQNSIIRRMIRNRKSRVGIVIFVLGYTLTFLGYYFERDFEYFDITTIIFKILPIVVTAAGLGYFLLGYLEGNKTSPERDEKEEGGFQNFDLIRKEFRKYLDELRHVQERNSHETQEIIEHLRHQVEQQNELHLDEKQRKEIFSSLKQSFSNNINEDFFKQLNENISSELTQEKRGRLDLIIEDFDRIKRRLNNEVDKLSRKANLNLVIGSLTTIVAFLALGYVVFQNEGEFKGYTDMVYHYVPRLSLIIFIEVFAYFFLRLYKLNLNDMKYFQNELTTVELKLSSITTAINFGKEDDISVITQELSKTERNFILKKGETTVDLEVSRNEKADFKEMLSSISDIIGNKRK